MFISLIISTFFQLIDVVALQLVVLDRLLALLPNLVMAESMEQAHEETVLIDHRPTKVLKMMKRIMMRMLMIFNHQMSLCQVI